jgi:hypothetical protein
LKPAIDALQETAQHKHQRYGHEATCCDDLQQLGVIHGQGSDSDNVMRCGA